VKTLQIRKADEKEFPSVYNFVSSCKPLESYPEHFYKIMLRYFGNSCIIAEFNGEIVGFVMGFTSQVDDKKLFLWQIGVANLLRGNEIAKMLLEKFEKVAKKLGCKRIEVTVDPENIPSQKLFEKMGYLNVSAKEGETVEVMGNTAVKDYYKAGRHFMLFEKNV